MKGSRNQSLEEIADHLKKSTSAILLPHVYIDGDDLGSMLALSMGLEKLGKTCHKVCHEPVPLMFGFLPRVSDISTDIPPQQFDSAILIECTNLSRLPEGMNVRSFARTIINIDHHPGNSLYGDLNYVDNSAAAVGEIIYDLLNSLGVDLDHDMALSLYLSILTDTGGFQFANTTAKTHRIVSDLLRFQVDVDRISRQIFRSLEFNVLKLRGEVFSTLVQECGGRIVWGALTPAMMEKYAVEDGDTQHLIEDINVIRDADVVVLFKVTGNGSVRVSLRSRELPVNEVAKKYDGGGHVLAAGCTLTGTLSQVKDEIVGTLMELLDPGEEC